MAGRLRSLLNALMPTYLVPAANETDINAIFENQELFFLFSEVAALFMNNTTANALKVLTRAANSKPHAAVAKARVSIVTVKAAGVHAQLAASALIKSNDYSTKLVPAEALAGILSHVDPRNGAATAQAILKAAMAAHTVITPKEAAITPREADVVAKKAKQRNPTHVPRLLAPLPKLINKQRLAMKLWATGTTAIRSHPSFKGPMQESSFDTSFGAGPDAFMAWQNNVKGIPLHQLQFSTSGVCSTFSKKSLEAFDDYCLQKRSKDSFRTRANSMKGLVIANKWLIRDQPYDPLRPTPEESFIKGMSAKSTELQKQADKQRKPLPEATPRWVDANKCRRRCVSILRKNWKAAPNHTPKAKMDRALLGRRYMVNAFFTLDSTKRASAIRKLKLHRKGMQEKQVIKLKKKSRVQLEYKGSGSYKVSFG